MHKEMVLRILKASRCVYYTHGIETKMSFIDV